nr:hypothetical protein GTC16762_33950 [Pigmentibacter ruber]
MKTVSKNNLTPKKYPTAGQPTKYLPEYVEQVEAHMARGLSFESFGGKIKVDKVTLYNWCAVHPEFKAAKERGTEASRMKLELMLLRTAKTGKGNVIAQIYIMKNKFPEEWRDRREIELKKDATEQINNLTLDQQIEKIEAMRSHLMSLKAQQQAPETLTIEAVPTE